MGVPGHQYPDFGTFLYEKPDQYGGLVRGNTAGYTNQYLPSA
jgi:hypothetical protein